MIISETSYFKLDPEVLKWLSDYLSQCLQFCHIHKFPLITKGVPQGSLLGPTLFSMYTSNLAADLAAQCQKYCYADDVQLLVRCNSSNLNEIALKEDRNLDLIISSSMAHDLLLNPS